MYIGMYVCIYIYIIVMVLTTSRQMPHTEIDDSIKSSRSFWGGGGATAL